MPVLLVQALDITLYILSYELEGAHASTGLCVDVTL